MPARPHPRLYASYHCRAGISPCYRTRMDRSSRPFASFGFAMTVCSRFFRASRLGAPLAMLALAATLSGCGEKANPLTGDSSVSQLWKAGLDELNDENYGTAAKIFDAVEQQHPYSVW